MEKYHKQDVSPIERENERDENYKSDNPQIDSSKTKYNYHMHGPDGSYTEFINKRITQLILSPRKDAVVMNSFVVGADRAFFDGLSKLSQYNFFSDCTKFFEERYGMKNVISAVIHVDETTPHMHLNLCRLQRTEDCAVKNYSINKNYNSCKRTFTARSERSTVYNVAKKAVRQNIFPRQSSRRKR